MDDEKLKFLKQLMHNIDEFLITEIKSNELIHLNLKQFKINLNDGKKILVQTITKIKDGSDYVIVIPKVGDDKYVMVLKADELLKNLQFTFPTSSIKRGEGPVDAAKRCTYDQAKYFGSNFRMIDWHFVGSDLNRVYIYIGYVNNKNIKSTDNLKDFEFTREDLYKLFYDKDIVIESNTKNLYQKLIRSKKY